ncbi:MAG: hypothetical protein DMG70_04820 [Acidobacteria bacterium]|nr:MAG: hypothetical protein DMG70_04820 [Acidobacteriota bacterium]PYY10899.1 MAG: hypothetical protein DMG69_05265 [Acidobacteriota bacterium]
MIRRTKPAVPLIALISTFVGSIVAQNSKAVDISAVAAAGRLSDDKYSNSLLRITVDAPNGTLQANPLVNKEAGRVRLVQILSKQTTWEDTYAFAVLADTLARYPQLQSPAHYVRSVRHQLEKEGLVTLREEFPITIGGVQFTGAILQQQVPNGRKHCRGLYTTFRDGFIVSFDAEAATEEKLNELVKRLVNFAK